MSEFTDEMISNSILQLWKLSARELFYKGGFKDASVFEGLATKVRGWAKEMDCPDSVKSQIQDAIPEFLIKARKFVEEATK